MAHARRRVALCLFLLLMLTGYAQAQTGSIKTDLNSYPEPPLPALPPAGGKFFDPTFGTEIMRVTDESDGAHGGTAYSYWPTFNKDNTRLWARVDNGTSFAVLFSFNPTTFTLSGKELPSALPGGGYFHPELAIWSGTDPNVIYGLQSVGRKLWAYNAATRSYTLIHDFTTDLPAGHYLWQMSRSMDDNVFAFTQKDTAYNAVGFLVYHRSTNQVIYRRTTPDIDEVQIDKSGRYLVSNTGRQGAGEIENEVIDLLNGSVERLTDDAPDYATGHADNGNGNRVGADNWLNRITFRNLATPHTIRTVFNFNNMWDNDYHISQLADDERWTLASFVGPSASGLFRRELVQIATDGSQRVRRLAHHRSIYADYYDSPRANISRDARFIAFTSNWGGRPRRDLFIVKIPPVQSTVNVALNKTATQSSTFDATVPASRAVDGNTNGTHVAGTISHTNSEAQAWWHVDLGGVHSIDSIKVWNRADCCPTMTSNFYVLVSDTPFASTNLNATLSQSGVSNYHVAGEAGRPTTLAVGRTGRYVRVQLSGTNYLTLSEVEVLGAADGGDGQPVYLSDLSWSYMTNHAYYPTISRDLSADGHTITLNGVSYQKGLGAHAPSEVRYNLNGSYETFLTDIGLDDEATTQGSVVFEVWADGVKLYDSGVMGPTAATQNVGVSVAGKQELKLVVTQAGDGPNWDHADWAGARLTAAAGGVGSSPTVGNPGFETPGLGAGGYQYAPAGATWSFTSGGGISNNGSGFTGNNPPAPEGAQVAFLQTTGTISQAVSNFQAGASYRVSFKAAQRAGYVGQDFEVLLDNNSLGVFRPASTSYAEISSATFTTTAGTHTLKFVGRNSSGGDNTAFIDDVRISPATGGQPVSWVDIVDATANANGGITKNVSGWWQGTANSSQSISGDGFFQCVINDNGAPNRYAMNVGLNSATTSPLDYYWAISSGSAHAYVNGQYKADAPVTTSDTLKIAVESGVVKFYKNGVLLYTSTVAPTYPLKGYWDTQGNGVGLTSASMAGN